jgi:TonB family protein
MAILIPALKNQTPGSYKCCFRSHLLTCVTTLLLGVALGLASAKAQEGAGNAGGRKAEASRPYNPVVPYDALIAGRAGSAEISFTVDYSGRAMLLNSVSATDTAFANAFMADIEAVEFSPPRLNGRALMSSLKERFDFPAQPKLDTVAQGILADLRKPKPSILSVDQLDKAPKPIRQPRPAYPWAQRSDSASGNAEIEFVIDRNGRPLFPHVISATHEDFGWAAATGILRWRYEPPVKNGEKVDTRIKVTVVFDINKSADMW